MLEELLKPETPSVKAIMPAGQKPQSTDGAFNRTFEHDVQVVSVMIELVSQIHTYMHVQYTLPLGDIMQTETDENR